VGYLAVPIDVAGGVTTASGVIPITLPTADSDTLSESLPTQVVEPPGARMVAFVNVRDRLRLLTKGTFLKAGGIAPSTAPTLTSTATRATTVLTFTGASNALARPSVGDTITIGDTSTILNDRTITWVDTLTFALVNECVRGANADASIANLTKMLHGTGTEHVDYYNATNADPNYWRNERGIEVSTSSAYGVPTATTANMTLRAVQSGTGGNSYVSTESGAQTSFGAATFTGGTAGTGTAPAAGTFRGLYTNFRDADQAETGPSPVASVDQETNGNITVTGLTANDDTTFDYTRYYRTRDTGVEFLLCKTIPRASTSVTDDISGDRLEDFGGVYDENLHQSYREGVPPIGKYLAVWKNRLWTGGAVFAAEYSRGTAAVTKTTTGTDNATVTLTGAYPTQAWVGRKFQVASTSEKYRILKVAGLVLTLDRGYEGTTNASASYTVRDERDASQVYGSEPGLWNLWPDKNNPGGVDTDDSGGVSGLMGFGDALIVMSKASGYRLTGDDEDNWQFHKAFEGFGCVEGRTLITVDGFGLMWLGWAGIYAWGGSGLPALITSPQRRGKFVRGIEGTIARINWPHVSQAFAHYSEHEKVVRFFVPLDNDVVPRHAIVLEVDAPGDWSLDHYPSGATAAGTVIGSDGKPVTLIGTQLGTASHAGLGSYDTTPDMSAIEAVVTLTGGTVRSATQGGTTWPTTNNGLAGVPCLVVYANGTAAENVIASNMSGVLTFAYDLDTAPASGDQVVIGGVWTRWRSGKFSLREEWSAKVLKDVVVTHSPEADGQYHFAFSADQSDPAIPTSDKGFTAGDLTVTSGRRRFRPQTRGHLHQIEYNLLEPGTSGHLRGHMIAAEFGAPLRSSV
jgi:hypothetical protein